MDRRLQITKAIKVAIIMVMYGLFIVKVYNIWIYVSFLLAILIIRYVEIKKGRLR